MNDKIKSVTEKLKIVKNMAQSNETKQVCDLVIELADALEEKRPLGFSSEDTNESKRNNKPKE